MTTSVVAAGFDVYDVVLAALQAAASTGGWTVYDGPTPAGDTPATYIVLGDNGSGLALDIGQEWRTVGLQPNRTETGVIHATVAAWEGDPALLSTCRTRVRSALADFDAVTRGVTSVPPVELLEVHLAVGEVHQEQTDRGAHVYVLVQLAYVAVQSTW